MSLAIRILDVIFSLIGLILLFIFLPAIWILLRLDSKGPLFYMAERVGKDMKPFKMYKFRTMLDTQIPVGECLCPQFDPRVTCFGRILRRTKINELPQLINILKGDMSFVGPRPESLELAEVYPDEAKRVFSVKPGLVGPSSIDGRNEEECYPADVDVKQYYLKNLLPKKVKLDLEYSQKISIINYLKFIFLGVKVTVIGLISMRHISSREAQIYLLIADVLLITCSYILSYNWCVWHFTGNLDIVHSTRLLPIVILCRLLFNQYFGLYRPLIKYISQHDIIETIKSNFCGTLFLMLISALLKKHSYSLLIGFLDCLALNIFTISLRIALITYFQPSNRNGSSSKKLRTLIYGVCDSGNHACKNLIADTTSENEVVGFIDDMECNFGRTIIGRKVLGSRYHIKDLVKLYNISMIVIADTNIKQKDLLAIISICAESDVKCGVFINNRSFNYNNIFAPTIRDMEISDFFKFEKVESNNDELANSISGKTIMFNATGGIVGIELCQRLIKLGCQKLIVLERYEAYLNEFLSATFYSRMNTIIKPVLLRGNGNDTQMLEDAFLAHHPNIVIQAGLRKFPSLHKLEVSDIEENNFTKNYFLANLAAKYDCEKFVMISTILDSNLNSEIVRTLSTAEIYLRSFFKNTNTEFIVVSMPDIAESYGGIVSIINKQVEERKTVVLPFQHGNSLIMSKDSAAELILQSITGGKENFLRRIHDNEGDSVVILGNLIKNFAKLYKLKFSEPGLWK